MEMLLLIYVNRGGRTPDKTVVGDFGEQNIRVLPIAPIEFYNWQSDPPRGGVSNSGKVVRKTFVA